MLQQQPGVHALSVVLVKARQHPQTLDKDKDATGPSSKSPTELPSHLILVVTSDLVVVERLQTHCAVVRLEGLGRVTPQFGLTVHFGLEGRHSLENILFREKLRKIEKQNVTEMLVNCS